MEEKIKKFCSKVLKIILFFGAIGSAFFFLIYILGSIPDTWEIIKLYLLEILIGVLFVWVSTLTILLIIKHSPKKENSNNVIKIIQKEISTKEKQFLEKLGKSECKLNTKIKDDVSVLERKLLDLRTNIPLKKINMGDLGKILNLDIGKGQDWRIDETLERIDKHIQKEGISHVYVTDLNKALNSLSQKYDIQKEAISKLIQARRC